MFTVYLTWRSRQLHYNGLYIYIQHSLGLVTGLLPVNVCDCNGRKAPLIQDGNQKWARLSAVSHGLSWLWDRKQLWLCSRRDGEITLLTIHSDILGLGMRKSEVQYLILITSLHVVHEGGSIVIGNSIYWTRSYRKESSFQCSALENKQHCSAAILDISQAFGRL
jgi:hypothetical protein